MRVCCCFCFQVVSIAMVKKSVTNAQGKTTKFSFADCSGFLLRNSQAEKNVYHCIASNLSAIKSSDLFFFVV